MRRYGPITRLLLGALAFTALSLPSSGARADTTAVNFEPPAFVPGSVNGQNGWKATGPYDQAVGPNVYGYGSFGTQTLRISNAVTSGSFGDQIFSSSLANEAGETDAKSGGLSSGPRQRHFEASFDLASTMAVLQPGLKITVSPDRGDGARMSFLRINDMPSGIQIDFDDYQAGFAGPGCDGLNFVESTIATGLSRTSPHTIKFAMDFLDGTRNDVVRISVDGVVVHVGTSWEDYFRTCEPTTGPGFGSRTVDSLLFRLSSSPCSPSCAGAGFVVDNFNLTSTPTIAASVAVLETGGSTNVTEGGATDTILVWLTTQPTANVFISMGGTPQVDPEPHPLIFTPSNFSVPQSMTVTAIDDTVPEGLHTGTVGLSMTSPDPNYNQPVDGIATITVFITDNDGNFFLVETNYTTVVAEGGFTDTYLIKLVAAPTANVTVTAFPDSQVTVAPAALVFTPGNYSIFQTITVTAVDDAFIEGQHLGIITHATASTDLDFNAKPVPDVSAVILDNDPPDFTPPLAPVITNCPGGPLSTKTFKLTGTAEPFTTVTVFKDGVGQGAVAAKSSGAWLIILGFPSNGTFSITANSTDAAGNVSPLSVACSITVAADNTRPPAPTITSPANNAITPATFVVAGDAFADTAKIRLIDNGEKLAEFAASAPFWSTTFTTTSGLHVMTAFAIDAAGNVSPASNTVTFTTDADPPRVNIRKPMLTVLVQIVSSLDATWSFDGTASDAISGIDHIQIQVSDVLGLSPDATFNASGCAPCRSGANVVVHWSDDLTAGAPQPGLYSVSVTAFDLAGNSTVTDTLIVFTG